MVESQRFLLKHNKQVVIQSVMTKKGEVSLPSLVYDQVANFISNRDDEEAVLPPSESLFVDAKTEEPRSKAYDEEDFDSMLKEVVEGVKMQEKMKATRRLDKLVSNTKNDALKYEYINLVRNGKEEEHLKFLLQGL